MRHPSSIVLVPLIALGLAGCTSGAESAPAAEPASTPRPTPSSEACSPMTATSIEWGEHEASTPAPVGFRTLTIGAGGQVESMTESRIEYESTVTRDVAGGETGWSDPADIDALIESAKADGINPDSLGDPAIDFDASSAEVVEPGDYVTGYRLEQAALPFTLECGGGLTGEGVLTTSGGGLGLTLVGCDGPPVVGPDAPEADRDYALSLQEQCPA